MVLPRMIIQEMNKQLSIINRVVIHPKYRTVGLGAKLIHETIPRVGTQYVELIAVMVKYSPFAEKAGMRKVVEQQSVEGVKRLTQTLFHLGFDLQLLGSQRYVQSKLVSLNEEQIGELKAAFTASKHPRFKKEVASSRHEPYGKTGDYVAYIQTADSLKMVRLISFNALPNKRLSVLEKGPPRSTLKSISCPKMSVRKNINDSYFRQ